MAAASLSLSATFSGTPASADPSPASSAFVPISPCRLLDTRPGDTNVGPRAGALGPGEVLAVDARGEVGNCVLPGTATALSMNVVAIEPTANSFLTVYPASGERPNASNLNWSAGQAPTPNAVTTALSDTGRINLFNLAGTVHLAVDVVGYWITNSPTSLQGPTGGVGPQGPAGPAGPQGAAGAAAIDPPTIIWVAPWGGDFTDLSDALDSITDNSATKPYLVRLAPGVYDEDEVLDLPDWVELQGSGPGSVITSSVTRGRPSVIDIWGAEGVAVRDLAIETTDLVAIAIYGTTTDVELRNLDIRVSGSGSDRQGVWVGDAEVTISDSTITVADGATALGVQSSMGANVTVERSSITMSSPASGAYCSGVNADGGSVDVVDTEIDLSFCLGVMAGVELLGSSTGRMIGSETRIAADAGALAFGVRTTDSTLTIDESRISGTSGNVLPLYSQTSTTLVRDSTLVGIGYGLSITRHSGELQANDVVLEGATQAMAGRCVNAVTTTMDPYTCV